MDEYMEARRYGNREVLRCRQATLPAPGVRGRGTRGYVALPLNDDGETLG